MTEEKKDTHQRVIEYTRITKPLFAYLPWLESSAGHTVSNNFDGQGIRENSVTFPVFDGTLMRFVKEASRSPLMDKNYRYIYTRNRIKTPEDEKRVIQKATLKEWDILCGILSRYILGGMTKGYLWGQGVSSSVLYQVLHKMKYVLEYWDKPLKE
ncbi:MAG: hypothetical protein LBM60_07120 [Clostridium sp.]|nr:hypothetical protein [Clostridium sp.]